MNKPWRNDTRKVWFQLHVSWINSCAFCIARDRTISRWFPLPFHPRCRCSQVPIYPGQLAQPEIDVIEEVRKQPEAVQSRVVGKSNLILIKTGLADWDDVIVDNQVQRFRDVVERLELDTKDLVESGIAEGIAKRAISPLVSSPPLDIQALILQSGFTAEELRTMREGSVLWRALKKSWLGFLGIGAIVAAYLKSLKEWLNDQP